MSALPATTRRPTRTLLLVPEIFSSEGGIPRILRNYLRALCDLGGPDGTVRLLALNDPSFPASAFTSLPPGRLESAMACGRRKGRLIREALRLLAHYVGDIHQPLHVAAVYLDREGRVVDPSRWTVRGEAVRL